MYKLVIQDDEGKTTVVPLIRDDITVGRKEGNTIRLTERNVSRRHARITRANGSVAIEDLDSYNGVRVNGTRIQGQADLHASDRIQIGDYLIELKTENDEKGADPYGEQKTQPIERVDPMAATPPPEQRDDQAAAAAGPAPEPVSPTAAPTTQSSPDMANAAAAALADTDPGARAAATQPQTPARMVILSNNFPGREFELNKPAMVIGRTDDNDIVVNHRSISRHHAKIVQENGRFAIVDLQSSNGVRVNGEDYGKVELRRGDVVDLGHVRFRFVEPGEDFVFGRDAQAVDVAGGGGRGLVAALVALLVIGGGIGVFMMMRGGDEEPGQAQAAEAKGEGAGADGTGAMAAAEPSFDAAAEPAAPANPDVVESEELEAALEEARQAIQDEDWDTAADKAEEALAMEPDNPDAEQIAEQAASEKANQTHFDEFQKAVAARDHRTVAAEFAKIDHGSIYRDRAIDDHDRLRDDYLERQRRKAKRLANRGRCGEIDRMGDQARQTWTEVGDALARIERNCRDRKVADNQTGGQTGGGSKDPKPDDKDTNGGENGGAEAAASPQSVDDIIAEAKAAAKASQYGKALRLCEQALARQRGNQEVTMICVIASCNLKNAAKAQRYHDLLRSSGRKTMARQICLKQGIEVQ